VDVVERMLGLRRKHTPTGERSLPGAETPAHKGTEIVSGLPYRMGAMTWAIEEELACTLGDLLIRRTHIAFETRDNGRAAARRVADAVASTFDWDATRRDRELERYDAEVSRIFSIDP
jgi:glycerol-3-phosphate dehydrogenase